MLLFVGGIVYSFFYPLPYSREERRAGAGGGRQPGPQRAFAADHALRDATPRDSAVSVPGGDMRECARPALEERGRRHVVHPGRAAEEKVLTGRRAEVEVAGNGIYMMMNKAALNGLTAAVGTVSAGIEVKRLSAATPSTAQALEQRQPLSVVPLPLFNVREGYGAYIVPGVAVLIVQQTLLIAMTLMFGTWRESGTFPVARSVPAYFGMLIAFASVAVSNSLYFFGFVMWWQDYPRAGNFGGLMLFVALFSLSVASLGMFLGSLFRTRERSAQLLLCTAMPFLFLSGLSWPVEAMPWILQGVRWVIPSTAGIQGFIALNQLGASLQQIAAEAAALLGLLVVFVAAGLWRWRSK